MSRVTVPLPCPNCGDDWEVTTEAEQVGGRVWVQDGDDAECPSCKLRGWVHDYDEDGISIEAEETP